MIHYQRLFCQTKICLPCNLNLKEQSFRSWFSSSPGVPEALWVKPLKSSSCSTIKVQELYTMFSPFPCILNRHTKTYWNLFCVSRFYGTFFLELLHELPQNLQSKNGNGAFLSWHKLVHDGSLWRALRLWQAYKFQDYPSFLMKLSWRRESLGNIKAMFSLME